MWDVPAPPNPARAGAGPAAAAGQRTDDTQTPPDNVAGDQIKTGVPTGFLPVDLALLLPGRQRGFDIFERIGRHMVLFCAKGFPVTRKASLRLQQRGKTTLYVPTDQGNVLSRYAKGVLRSVVNATDLEVPRRSYILYTSARSIMADILANPSSPAVIKRGIALANTTVNFLIDTPAGLKAMASLFGKDYYTFTHCVHVCVLGVGLFRHLLSNNPTVVRRFGVGSLLHDVGKTAIGLDILNKPGRLTSEEFLQMKGHTKSAGNCSTARASTTTWSARS